MVTERSLVFGSLLVGSGLQFLFSIFPFVMGGSSSVGFGEVLVRPVCQPVCRGLQALEEEDGALKAPSSLDVWDVCGFVRQHPCAYAPFCSVSKARSTQGQVAPGKPRMLELIPSTLLSQRLWSPCCLGTCELQQRAQGGSRGSTTRLC